MRRAAILTALLLAACSRVDTGAALPQAEFVVVDKSDRTLALYAAVSRLAPEKAARVTSSLPRNSSSAAGNTMRQP